jgi:hypothetical protein
MLPVVLTDVVCVHPERVEARREMNRDSTTQGMTGCCQAGRTETPIKIMDPTRKNDMWSTLQKNRRVGFLGSAGFGFAWLFAGWLRLNFVVFDLAGVEVDRFVFAGAVGLAGYQGFDQLGYLHHFAGGGLPVFDGVDVDPQDYDAGVLFALRNQALRNGDQSSSIFCWS